MKKTIAQLIIAIPLCFLVGTIASASYTAPVLGPTGDSAEIAPISLGLNPQLKNGGLSVFTFLASGPAEFDQNVSFTGMIRGGTPRDTVSSVAFGDTTTPAMVKISGLTKIDGKFQSDVLKTGGGEKPLCATADGSLYLCNSIVPPTTPPPSQADSCPNLAGTQASVPSGMIVDANGDCVTVPTVTGYTFDPAGEDVLETVCNKSVCNQVVSLTKRNYRLTINFDQPLVVDTVFTVNFEWKWYGYKDSASGVKSFTVTGTKGSTTATGTFLWSENIQLGDNRGMIPSRVRAYCVKVASPANQYLTNSNLLSEIKFTTLPIAGGLANGGQPYPGGPYSPVGISCQ